MTDVLGDGLEVETFHRHTTIVETFDEALVAAVRMVERSDFGGEPHVEIVPTQWFVDEDTVDVRFTVTVYGTVDT